MLKSHMFVKQRRRPDITIDFVGFVKQLNEQTFFFFFKYFGSDILLIEKQSLNT